MSANYHSQLKLSCSGYFQLRQVRPIIRSLTMEAAKMIGQAFISCRLDYCNSLLLNSSIHHIFSTILVTLSTV